MSGEIYPNDCGDIKIRELKPGTAIDVEIITLRDRFAMAALNAIMREISLVRSGDLNEGGVSLPGMCFPHEIQMSEIAYRYADAMMAARETKKPEAR